MDASLFFSQGRNGFDFTSHIHRLAEDMARRLDDLAHVDMARVAIRFCQARKAVSHGLQASLTPLRFQNGQLTIERRGRVWTIERVVDASGREMLYLLSFYLPRFLNMPWREKLATVIHELWHIGPQFDGDLRRHPGRCYAHSHSQSLYDALVEQLVDKYMELDPPAELHEFLHYDFDELEARFGAIFGQTIPTPKLIRAAASK